MAALRIDVTTMRRASSRKRLNLADMTWRGRGLAEIIEQIPFGVAITLPDETLEYANRYLRNLLGLDNAGMASLAFSRLKPGTSGSLAGEITRSLAAGETWHGETRIRKSSGETCDILESVYPLCDAAGRVMRFFHLVQDISMQKQVEALSALAFYDSLTGLPNRNLFKDRLARVIAIAQRNLSGFALLYIDVDHFKRMNDMLGHDAGDELLRQVASRLAKSLRNNDTVARWGGDEFVAILDAAADPSQAARISHKLLVACGAPFALDGKEHRITLSIGASLYPRDGHDMITLLKRADQAMYQVKARGRNGYRVCEYPAIYQLNPAHP